MNKRVLLPLLLLLGLVLAACADAPQATPTAEAVSAPVEAAPVEAGPAEAEPPEAAPVDVEGAPLTAAAALGVTWQWTVLRQADSPMPGVVPFPENYTITFMEEGVAAIRADCNNVIGEYTLGDDGSLSIVLGPSTMVACGDASQDAQYLNLLSKVVRGSITADGLTLVTGDGEQLGFIAADGTAGAPAGSFDMAAMQNVLWQWTSLTETDPASQTAVPNPEAYTIAFLEDGSVAIQADCNMVRGGYGTTDGASGVVINLGPSTRAFCGEESLDQQFLALLAEVQRAELTAGGLLLSTTTGATLGFANGGPYAPDAGTPETGAPADPVADEALNNILWQWTDLAETDPAALSVSPNPEQYTIGFQYGGTVAIQADCNRVGGSYAREGEALSIQLGPSTMAFCGEESLDQQFLALLGEVSGMAVEDGRLTLTTASGATLGFRDGGLLPGAVGLKPSQISFASTGQALAYETRVVPATPYDESSPPGPSGLPEHLQVTFGDAADMETPVLYIIPAAAYEALWAANENESVSRTLEQIAELIYITPDPGPTSGVPVLPQERITGVNDVAAQFAGLPAEEAGAAKDGYRFAGRFAQDPAIVLNNSMQFIAQAFTNDGEYLVAFFYPPLTTDLLPTALDEVPAEQTEAYTTDPLGQIELVTAELNNTTAADWQPDLNELDALVAALRIDGMAANGLEGRTWLWTGRTPVGGEFQPVADPARYMVTYNEDGTLFFQADCNSGGGSYAALGGLSGSVTHALGAMTLASCPDGSRMDEFTGALSAVRSFRVLPGGQALEMALPAGGEVLSFALEGTLAVDLTPVEPPQPATPTGTVIAPDGVFVRTGPGTAYPSIGIAPLGTTATIIGRSEDSQWWVANAAASPTGLGWVSVAFVAAENVENVPVIATPPLPTPVPTPTPVPPPPASISFRADQTTINAGECTTLRWDVENIQAVWVFPQGQDFSDFPVTGQGSQQVCPDQTTTYQMRVQHVDGSVELRSITITVNQPNTLIDTSWQLATLNVNQLPVGGPLTLNFLGESSVSMQGGCNTFNGPYSAFYSGISIGPLFGTQRACEEGLMAQEAAYLQAIESATTFTNDGSTLVLFGPGGEVARFTAIVATPFGG